MGKRGIGQGSDARARHHGGHGAALERGGDKVVPVEPLAAHGKKQFAGRDRARVDGVAGRDRARRRSRTLDGASSTAPAPIAASASVRFIALPPIAQFAQDGKRYFGIVERNGAVGEDLFFLVALAGNQNDVAGRAAWSARRMAAARSGFEIY